MRTTPNPRPRESEALIVNNTEGVLSLVPEFLGFAPTDSLVSLLMSGRELQATMRLDLPAPEDISAGLMHHYAERHAAYVEAAAGIDHIMLVVYADIQEAGELPFGELLDQIVLTAHRHGLSVFEVVCVAGGRWRHYTCASPGCCGAQGHPLPEATAASLEMQVRGGSRPSGLWDGTDTRGWPEQEAVLKRVEAVRRSSPAALIELLQLWATALEHGNRAGEYLRSDAAVTARLLASLLRYESRNFVVAMAAGVLERAEMASREDASRDPDAADFMADRRLQRCIERSVRLLLGDLDVAPDWSQLDRLWNICRELVAVADGPIRSSLLSLLAWIEWARGRSSAASRLIEAAEPSPDDTMGIQVGRMIAHGHLARWTKSRGTAWCPSTDRAA